MMSTTSLPRRRIICLIAAAVLLLPCTTPAVERGARLRSQRAAPVPIEAMALPAHTRVIRDVAYGADPRQRFDVYLPAQAHRVAAARLPVIVMVHGGGWVHGDKRSPGVVENKARWWLPRGYALISVNYRMLPDTAPLEQARDVAGALASAQRQAGAWGLDRDRFVLMGHSAGAHLVALLAASPHLARAAGAIDARGAILLDSGALDVEAAMRRRHLPLFDRAFGSNPAYWRATSPLHALSRASWPMLAVCSTRRRDICAEAHRMAAKADANGVRMQVLDVDLSHRDINAQLGVASTYTRQVDAFLRSLTR